MMEMVLGMTQDNENTIFVKLIDSMGTDLSVVNAARVSFGKRKEEFTEGDKFLIKYLAEHGHWSPFAHCSAQFHIRPLFLLQDNLSNIKSDYLGMKLVDGMLILM